MTIKDILLPLTSYPTPTQKCAIESAVALAATMGALVEAIAFEVNVQSLVGLYADPVGVAGVLAADRKKSAYAHQLLDAFEAIARGAGIAHERRVATAQISAADFRAENERQVACSQSHKIVRLVSLAEFAPQRRQREFGSPFDSRRRVRSSRRESSRRPPL